MFPIILIVVFTALILAGIAGMIVGMRSDEAVIGAPSFLLGFVAACLLTAVIAIWPTVYFGSVGVIARMEAFYYDTLDSYEYTVTATGQIEITNAEPGLLDIAYQQQGVATSERLRELRDRIDWYNAKLRHYQRFNSFAIADPFLADTPVGLAPITLSINGVEQTK